MVPANQSIEIFFTYENKTDYYEIDWNINIRIIEVRLNEIPSKQLKELSELNETVFRCPYEIWDDIDYSIIVIANPCGRINKLQDTPVYLINKETFEVTLQFYPNFYQCKIMSSKQTIVFCAN